jgi:hypothetical protein
MKNSKNCYMTLLLLAIIALGFAQAQESMRLQYKFQKGKTYMFKAASSGESTQEAMGREMKMSSSFNLVARVVVEDVLADGGMILTISADSAVSRSKNPMMDTTMNLTYMVGKKMRVTLSPVGNVKNREVIDSVRYESRGVVGRVPQREVMGFLPLPEKPVKMGEKWTQSKVDTTESMGGKNISTSDIEYTLVGTEDKLGHKCLKIVYAGKTTITGRSSRMGMEMFTEGDGKTSGTIFFDLKQGVVIVSEKEDQNEMTMAMTGQQNMTIPMSSTNKSTQVLLEK